MTAKRVGKLRVELQRFVERFSAELGRSERRHWCGKYLEGLLLEGERKSIEPMSARVDGGDEQALQQFVNQSPWQPEPVLQKLQEVMFSRHPARSGVLVLDDTSLPKQGHHSVGVARQYCGALGKVANCQSIVTWHWAGESVHWPLAARLYLPKEWTLASGRLDRAGVPLSARTFREKWRLALELLDEMKAQLPAYRAVVFDAGYGVVLPLLRELEARGERYVAQIPSNVAAWPMNTKATLDRSSPLGRPRLHARVEDHSQRPLSAAQWCEKFLTQPRRWKRVRLPNSSGHSVRAVAVRVKATQRRSLWRQPGVERWLIIEEISSGIFKYYLSNLPASATVEELIELAHERWKIEQGYQQLKEEIGLDHFEGRSWLGLHHHLVLCFMAFGFLASLRLRAPKKTSDAS